MDALVTTQVLTRQRNKLWVAIGLLGVALLLAVMAVSPMVSKQPVPTIASTAEPRRVTPMAPILYPPRHSGGQLQLQGKAKPGETVMLALNGELQTTATADCAGQWQGSMPIWKAGSQVVTAIRGNRCSAEADAIQRVFVGDVLLPKEQLHALTSAQKQVLLTARKALPEQLTSTVLSDGRLLLTLAADDYFSSSDVITSKGNESLQALAITLRAYTFRWLVVAHTDNQDETVANLQRAKRWANTIKQKLSKSGVLASSIFTHGFGDQYPQYGNTNPRERALNRRIEIIIGF